MPTAEPSGERLRASAAGSRPALPVAPAPDVRGEHRTSRARREVLGEPARGGRSRSTYLVWAVLGVVLAGALALRLWGVKEGLPYVYDVDEAAHFVPRAIAMSGTNLNPHYFANPPALTYLLHGIFAALFGGYAGVTREAALHPGEVYLVARVTVAVLGMFAVWLLYVLGSRLFSRSVGLLAAALEAVAFLPVFYAHLALNDVPALVPLTASLVGAAGVMKHGRARDYALAGVGLGLGAATKYTAGVVVLPLIAATAIHYAATRARASLPGHGTRRVPFGPFAGFALAALLALISFLIANPYALLDSHSFLHELAHESAVAEEAGGKLGSPHEVGLLYYAWTFTWGLGYVPAIAALAGAVAVWFKDRRVAWLLTPMIVAYLVFMGTQERFFGRWLMPLLPIACVLAGFFTLVLVDAIARRFQHRAAIVHVASALAAALLLAQGLTYSVHSDLVLSHADTRASARAWLLAHLPAGARVVPEPVVPQAWLHEDPALGPRAGALRPRSAHDRWSVYPSLLARVVAVGPAGSGRWQVERRYARVEDYEHTLSPTTIDYYEQQGYCWVLTSSQQAGRAFADPSEASSAIDYYRALERDARVVYRISPYADGRSPGSFNFDWSFDYYPLADRLPGPEMTLYRLRGGSCARGA